MAGLILRTVLTLKDRTATEIEGIAERWVAATRAEAGVLGFHGFMARDHGSFVFLEHYRDSEAFMIHRGLVDPELRAALYRVADFVSLEVYGDPSPDMREALSRPGIMFYSPVASR